MAHSDPDVEVSSRAYAKVLLHAAKYPHCSINGLLLAPKSCLTSNIGSDAAVSLGKITISDAIPLFHQNLGLSPMLEVALAQVDSVAASAGLIIAGYYHANELFRDTAVDVFSQRIADRVAENCPGAVLLTLDNKRLGVAMTSHPFIIQQNVDGRWRSREKSSLLLAEEANEAVATLLQKKMQKELVDFDNHLDDLAKNYLNVELNLEIDEIM